MSILKLIAGGINLRNSSGECRTPENLHYSEGRRGFSLVEMMIALFVGALLISKQCIFPARDPIKSFPSSTTGGAETSMPE